MSDLDELKKKRLEQLQNMQQQADSSAQEQEKLMQQVASLEAMVKPRLTPEALQRYGNLKIGHPDLAVGALVTIAQLMQRGRLERVDDLTLKALLVRLQGKKREIKINRK